MSDVVFNDVGLEWLDSLFAIGGAVLVLHLAVWFIKGGPWRG